MLNASLANRRCFCFLYSTNSRRGFVPVFACRFGRPPWRRASGSARCMRRNGSSQISKGAAAFFFFASHQRLSTARQAICTSRPCKGELDGPRPAGKMQRLMKVFFVDCTLDEARSRPSHGGCLPSKEPSMLMQATSCRDWRWLRRHPWDETAWIRQQIAGRKLSAGTQRGDQTAARQSWINRAVRRGVATEATRTHPERNEGKGGAGNKEQRGGMQGQIKGGGGGRLSAGSGGHRSGSWRPAHGSRPMDSGRRPNGSCQLATLFFLKYSLSPLL